MDMKIDCISGGEAMGSIFWEYGCSRGGKLFYAAMESNVQGSHF
jgi:hypothetical protein